MHSQNLLCIFQEFCTSYMHSQKFHLYMNSQNKFMHAYILKENKNKSKKNHTFINTFSKRKSPKFYKCIFSQKKNHSNIHHICIQKQSCIHKSIFSEKNLSNMHYICIKKNHVFISAFSEKIHAFIHSNIYHICIFQKTKSQKFHKCVLEKIIKFSKEKKKRKEKYGESFVYG